MSDITIKVEDLGKQYRLGEVGTGTLVADINSWWHRIRGKENPYKMIGDVNVRSEITDSEYVWALKDVNLEVRRGEVLGIIGKNGAGKSTLLKILSKVTGPTTGRITMLGRVASLLEVGTGFHAELTGRENIYLNGAILGMTRTEIKAKIDEIIDFSGIAKYIDTPVKRYSSGMRVRLGFAVAAHLEPEILIVDEVLAVGDAEFQKRAVGKMQSVSKEGGRTVLFVSHNMLSIESLCTRVIVMEDGGVCYNGEVHRGIQTYMAQSHVSALSNTKSSGEVEVQSFTVQSKTSNPNHIGLGDPVNFKVRIKGNVPGLNNVRMVVIIYDSMGREMFRLINQNFSNTLNIGVGEQDINILIPNIPLKPDKYFATLIIRTMDRVLFRADEILAFDVLDGDFFGSGRLDQHAGQILVDHEWIY